MPTLIDSLVVELGLDPKKFTAGQRQALASFKQTQQEAQKTAKSVEASGERASQFFSKMRNQALSFLGLLVGGYGLKQFVQNVTTADAQVGRMSRTIQTSTETLSTWRGVATLTGGDADATAGSIQGMVNQFQMFAITGQSQVIPYFRALGVQVSDASGRMRPFEQIMADLADAFKKMEPARARAFGLQLGLDEGTINILLRGGDALRQLLAEQRALGIVTKDNADQAEALAKAWQEASLAAIGLGRDILNFTTPALVGMLNRWRDVFQELRRGDIIAPNSLVGRLLGMSTDTKRSRRSGGGAPAPAPPSADSGGLRLKRGATAGGDASVGIMALAQSLQNEIPGLDRFTAINDQYHALLGAGGGKHGQGLALDFSLKDAGKSEDVANRIRARLAALGIDATVIDEYKNPSRHATAGHIHVGFANAAAAARYAELSKAGQGGGMGGPRTVTNTTTIGSITVNTQATDAEGIARDLPPAIGRASLSAQAQQGPN